MKLMDTRMRLRIPPYRRLKNDGFGGILELLFAGFDRQGNMDFGA